MNLRNLTRIAILCACLCLSSYLQGFAQQQNHRQTRPLESAKVTIESFDWMMNDSSKRADVTLTITNHTNLDIKKINLFLTGQDERKVMLQSGTHTIKQKSCDSTIAPNQTKQIVLRGAYNNQQIGDLQLKQVIFEFSNGSLEILR